MHYERPHGNLKLFVRAPGIGRVPLNPPSPSKSPLRMFGAFSFEVALQ